MIEQEVNFIATVEQFEPESQNVDEFLQPLEQWLDQLTQQLTEQSSLQDGLHPSSRFTQQAQALHTTTQEHINEWSQKWQELGSAQSLADIFENTIILLVFGKFNAGKSSFCNFLAERFASHGQSVQYFSLEQGHIVQLDSLFQEGSTETTAHLQGVILGEKLVLLDTPGLHSVTTENAELTQRFTESADGMLWLTSSASPGQVQELDELARELRRRKPLLPIITRSDFIEEDEVDGEIKKVLCNKTPANRQLQEKDVKTRASEKLTLMEIDVEQLKSPVSISVFAARNLETQAEKTTPELSLKHAGFEALYTALQLLIEPAITYKSHKSVEILQHHLEENILGSLDNDILPRLEGLEAEAHIAQQELGAKQQQLINAIWRQVVPTLPALLEQHEEQREVAAIYQRLGLQLNDVFEQQAQTLLADYTLPAELYDTPFTMIEDVGYEVVMLDDGQVVDVSYEALHTSLEKAIHTHLTERSLKAKEAIEQTTQALKAYYRARQKTLRAQISQLPHPKTGQTLQRTASQKPSL